MRWRLSGDLSPLKMTGRSLLPSFTASVPWLRPTGSNNPSRRSSYHLRHILNGQANLQAYLGYVTLKSSHLSLAYPTHQESSPAEEIRFLSNRRNVIPIHASIRQ